MTSLSPHPMTDRRLTLLSIVLLIGGMTILLDTTIVNVALDRLHDVFHASVADTQWISSGYLLALAGVIPLSGWLSERFGTKPVWMSAMAVFMIGSALCGFAWDLPSLIGFRVLQGIGGGIVLPVMITILTQAAGPSRLARAIIFIAVPANLAPIIGPIVGGAIVDSISWHWLFFVNVPLCILALALAVKLMPSEGHDSTRRIDLPGFLLLTPGLVALAFGISEAVKPAGFGGISSWLPITLGVVLIVSFVVYALHTTRIPLVDVRVFGRRSFGIASVITFAAGFSSFAAMFLIPQFYQVVRGDSALTTGLLLIPLGAGTIVFFLLNKPLSAAIEPRFLVMGGVVLTMIAMVPFALAGVTGSLVPLLIAEFLQGVGVGAVLLPITTLAFISLERAQIPRAGASFSVVQRVGAPFGVTVVAVLLEASIAARGPGSGHLVAAFGSTFWWVAAFSVVPLVLAFFLPRRSVPASPVQVAETAVAETS